MVSMLNSCDRVLAVSNFVRAKFESVGVSPAVLRTVPIGTRAARVAARFSELVFDPPPFDATHPRPIRMVFMGYNNVYKGLPMLADTLELLTPEVLGRFHLYLYAQSLQSIEWRFRRLEPRLGGLTVGYGYQYYDVPWLCGGKDLGLVTSVWWDNAPQTVFEFFANGLPVLAADIGGIPDFVQDGRNGLLFCANDRYDLARRLAALARDPTPLAELRKNVRAPKDIAEHAGELEALYAECIGARNASPPENRSGLPLALAAADP
jgi:glycosyltransferase involved in cell wall biosynthesis